MAPSIDINKKNVKDFLESGKDERFIIPEYQRPYAWGDEEVQTLFDDLVEYTHEEIESPYFLGTIVSYTNQDEGEKFQEIIDGQQRITTLFLLLRAIYSKLQSMDETKEKKNFIQEIEPALWERDKMTGEADKSKILIESRVFESKYNNNLVEILKTGEASKDSKDQYSKNYLYCQELIDEYAKHEPLSFYQLIYNILHNAIVLPIKADSQETALTIFSTLNDRGLSLSDADIFKAKIYNNLKDQEARNEFIGEWQNISVEAEYADESIQKLFYYYMFYLRAIDNDRKSTTPGLRKYYASDRFSKLYDDDLMKNLNTILNLWTVINRRETLTNESWSQNIEILKVLDMLTSYPNEFWKYPVCIYYMRHHTSETFENNFLLFLKKLFANLCSCYIVTPTINAVKQSILNLNAEIIHSESPKFSFKQIALEDLKEDLKTPHRNVVRMLLKLIAYDEPGQMDLLPQKWEIEHILPRKWQDSYFPDTSQSVVDDTIEHLGNKIPFEKRLNIVASNGYFEKKKAFYGQSAIKVVKDLADLSCTDWKLDQILERDIRLSDKIITTIREWSLDLEDSEKRRLTQEELEAIELIKASGLKDYI